MKTLGIILVIGFVLLIVVGIAAFFLQGKARKLLSVPVAEGADGIRSAISRLNADALDLDLALGLCENQDQIKLLLEAGANPMHQFGTAGFSRWSAATNAALKGRPDALAIFLQHGVSANARMDDAASRFGILEYACLGGNIDCVRMLCERGAEINYKNSRGEFALLYAAACGRLDIVEYLHEVGADVTLKDNQNRTALDWARNTQYSDAQFKELSRITSVLRSKLGEVVAYLESAQRRVEGGLQIVAPTGSSPSSASD